MLKFFHFLNFTNNFININTSNNEQMIYSVYYMRNADKNIQSPKKSIYIGKPNEFASEMLLQTNKYLCNCKSITRQNIASLIMQIITKRKILFDIENAILMFVNKSKNMQTDFWSSSYKNLSWTEKLLLLILYYAYDFFHDIEITIVLKKCYGEVTVGMKRYLLVMIQNQAYQKHSYDLMKAIYTISLEANFTLRQIIDISANDMLPNKDYFKKILGILLNEIYKIIVFQICYNEYADINTKDDINNFKIYHGLMATLNIHPNYFVLWRDISKPKFIASYSIDSVSNLQSISKILNSLYTVIKKFESQKHSHVLVFDVDIYLIILSSFVRYTYMRKKDGKVRVKFEEVFQSVIFGNLYCSKNTVPELAANLRNLETILIECANSHYSKTNAVYDYMLLYIVYINYDDHAKELCEILFNKHYIIFGEIFEYQEQFKSLVNLFFKNFKNLIKNSFKSINSTVCGYIEINQNEFSMENEHESLSYILKKNIYVPQKPKSQKEFESYIIKDQKKWYEKCSDNLNNLLTVSGRNQP